MAIRFNKVVRPGDTNIVLSSLAESYIRDLPESGAMVFLSHKTGDEKAENLALYLSNEHQIKVYMAEWDNHIYGDSSQLPDYIIEAIRKSNGFLVHVTHEIGSSMWIGYEIGAAHAMKKERAKVLDGQAKNLPSVVDALQALRSRYELDLWIRRKVL